MECLPGLQWWLLLPRLSLGVSLHQVSPVLHFWSDASDVSWGTHLDFRSLRACWTPVRQRCLSTPGNCWLFSWGFSSSGHLSEVAQWLSFATTPQLCIPFARGVAPGLLSSTPWLRRSCARWSPSPSACLPSSFRAPTPS